MFARDAVFITCHFAVGETEYEYSGSEDEGEEPPVDGEPSSIALAPSESTLRRNFLKLQQENKERFGALEFVCKGAGIAFVCFILCAFVMIYRSVQVLDCILRLIITARYALIDQLFPTVTHFLISD